MSADLTSVQQTVSTSEPGTVILELEVVKNGQRYRMVGVCMSLTSSTLTMAFNAKAGTVIDDVDIVTDTIYAARVVPNADIVVLG
jgi:hypothetical protein